MSQTSLSQTNLIKMLGIQDLSDEEKMRIIEQVTEIVELRVLERAYTELSEDERATLEEKMEADDPQAVIEYLRTQVDGYESIVEEEIEKARQELYERHQTAREKAEEEVAALERNAGENGEE